MVERIYGHFPFFAHASPPSQAITPPSGAFAWFSQVNVHAPVQKQEESPEHVSEQPPSLQLTLQVLVPRQSNFED